jgi:hypothetical protein
LFRSLIRAAMADPFVGTCYDTIRILLAMARFLNGVCYLMAALLSFGVAVYLVERVGDRIPAYDLAAFLIAWFGLALATEGLEKLASTEPKKEIKPSPPLELENREARADAVITDQFRTLLSRPREIRRP